MSLSRVKSWTTEVLTHSDLNAEFDNVLTFVNAFMTDGTVGVPGWSFSQDPDNGLYRIAANNWALVSGGTKALELDANANIVITNSLTNAGVVNLLATASASDATYSYTREQKTTGIAQSTTADIFRFIGLPPSNSLLGASFVGGLFIINVVDEASAANQATYIRFASATGNGITTGSDISSGSDATRGTGLVSAFALAADIGGAAVKLTMTTAASGKTVTARVTFIGMVK